jgi:hypothetical protein
MNTELIIRPKKVFKALFCLNIIIFLLSLFFCSLQYIVGRQSTLLNLAVKIFNVDNELFIPAFYSSILLGTSSVLFLVIAYVKHVKNSPFVPHWFFLSFIFLIMAWDEAVSIHELFIGNPFYENALSALGISLKSNIFFKFSWVVLGAFSITIFLFSYLKFFLYLSTYQKHILSAAFLVYVCGALGMEIVNSAVANLYTEVSLIYIFGTSIEELLEMMSISLLIYALLKFLEKEMIALIIKFTNGAELTND